MNNNLQYEKTLWLKGFKNIAGTDEVGRGCLAGPMVTASVIWDSEILNWEKDHPDKFELLNQITDSKKISPKKRDLLSAFIKENCKAYSIIQISNEEIDKNGVGECDKIGLLFATYSFEVNEIETQSIIQDTKNPQTSKSKSNDLIKREKIIFQNVELEISEKLTKDKKIKIDHILTDHFSILTPNTFQNADIEETPINQGDLKSISIASASIIAKVYRDTLMREKYHTLYPQYGFDKHVGYGTKLHKEAIRKYGLSPLHRKSFKI